jgi:hypothetical protein
LKWHRGPPCDPPCVPHGASLLRPRSFTSLRYLNLNYPGRRKEANGVNCVFSPGESLIPRGLGSRVPAASVRPALLRAASDLWHPTDRRLQSHVRRRVPTPASQGSPMTRGLSSPSSKARGSLQRTSQPYSVSARPAMTFRLPSRLSLNLLIASGATASPFGPRK